MTITIVHTENCIPVIPHNFRRVAWQDLSLQCSSQVNNRLSSPSEKKGRLAKQGQKLTTLTIPTPPEAAAATGGGVNQIPRSPQESSHILQKYSAILRSEHKRDENR